MLPFETLDLAKLIRPPRPIVQDAVPKSAEVAKDWNLKLVFANADVLGNLLAVMVRPKLVRSNDSHAPNEIPLWTVVLIISDNHFCLSSAQFHVIAILWRSKAVNQIAG
jgi:hypothetical protein